MLILMEFHLEELLHLYKMYRAPCLVVYNGNGQKTKTGSGEGQISVNCRLSLAVVLPSCAVR